MIPYVGSSFVRFCKVATMKELQHSSSRSLEGASLTMEPHDTGQQTKPINTTENKEEGKSIKVTYNDEDIDEGIRLYEKSLLGHVIMSKLINKPTIEVAMSKIWGNPNNFKMEEILGKTFQFLFNQKEDAARS